jgi:hypothetical protein
MPDRRRLPVLPMLLALSLAAACTPGVEGKYYNQAGEFVLELKGGKMIMRPEMSAMNANYVVRGDSIVLRDPQNPGQDAIALVRDKDGTIEGGMLGQLRKK